MIDHFMLAVFEHSQFALKVYRLREQRVVDHLRPKISQRLYGWSCFLVVTDNELILRWNPQFEHLAATDHVEHVALQDVEESDHPQRGRLPRQDVAADLLIFRDLAEFAAADGSRHADCSL